MARRGPFRFRARLLCVGLAASFVAVAVVGEAAAADTQRPTKPSGLAKLAATGTTVKVGWRASTDNVGVKNYRVWRNGTLVGTTALLDYTLTGLTCNTTYIVAVSAVDGAGNVSLPAAIFAKTAACGSETPVCATPSTVLALLLEHKLIEYGCGWPAGYHAREALQSIRLYLSTRRGILDTWRARKWHAVAMEELAVAINMSGAWNTTTGQLQANAAGVAALRKVHRVIRIMQYHNAELFEVTKAEKWALTAVTWYVAASRYNYAAANGWNTITLNSALGDLRRGDVDFFATNCYRAAGRYIKAFDKLR